MTRRPSPTSSRSSWPTSPALDQEERKLLIESLVEKVEIGKNKRVTASLQPPFAFGFLSPELAP